MFDVDGASKGCTSSLKIDLLRDLRVFRGVRLEIRIQAVYEPLGVSTKCTGHVEPE